MKLLRLGDEHLPLRVKKFQRPQRNRSRVPIEIVVVISPVKGELKFQQLPKIPAVALRQPRQWNHLHRR